MPDQTDTEGEGNQHVELSFPKALEDDWAGTSNPKERKKIQNRLAQRAYRQRNSRKGNLRIKFFNPGDKNHTFSLEVPARKVTLSHREAPVANLPPRTDNSSQIPIANTDEANVASAESVPLDTASGEVVVPGLEMFTEISILDAMRNETEDEPVYGDQWELIPPFCSFRESTDRDRVSTDHEFINLIYYNVFRAFEVITGSLGLTTHLLTLDILSPFNTVSLGGTVLEDLEEAMSISPKHDPAPNLPLALRPTLLQTTVLHHPYIDLFPSPRLRDNLLRAIGTFDDMELCLDIMGCDGTGDGISGLIVWGDPWDVSGWEVAEHFARKYLWMLEGCDDVIQATNYWRAMRGLRALDLGV